MNTHQQPSRKSWEEEFNKQFVSCVRDACCGVCADTCGRHTHDYQVTAEPEEIKSFIQSLLTSHSEAIREKVEGMRRDQKKKKESDPHFTGCGACGSSHPAICGCKEVNEVLDDILALLNDTNPEDSNH